MPTLCAKTRKRRYPNALEANLVVARIASKNKKNRRNSDRDEPIRSYQCEFCSGFHLTHQKKGEGRGLG